MPLVVLLAVLLAFARFGEVSLASFLVGGLAGAIVLLIAHRYARRNLPMRTTAQHKFVARRLLLVALAVMLWQAYEAVA
jgi:hypothetical protein